MQTNSDVKKALFTLNVAEGKRLIGKAVANLPIVKYSQAKGRLIIATGITNAFVAEELLGESITIPNYTAGIIAGGKYTVTDSTTRLAPICFENGRRSSRPWPEILKDFTKDDVFIKGANAIDLSGMAGILVGSLDGGTCGAAFGSLYARGSHLVVPASREKLIPSVDAAIRALGAQTFDESLGLPCGMIPAVGAQIVTEVEALSILFNVDAVQVSAGGVHGSEGSVGLAISGTKDNVHAAMDLIHSIKGEPPIRLAQLPE